MKLKITAQTRLGLLVFLSVAVILITTAQDYGVAWDEPLNIDLGKAFKNFYGNVYSGTDYQASKDLLFKELQINDRFLSSNEVESHPFVYRELLGLALFLAGNHADVLFVSRLVTILLVAALGAVLWVIAFNITRSGGFALLAPAMLLSCPRFFAHAHFAALDAPAAACIFCGTVLFMNVFFPRTDAPAIVGGPAGPARHSMLPAAVLFGLACGIKETSFIMMVPLFLAFLLFAEKTASAGLRLIVFFALVAVIFFITNIPFLLEPGLLFFMAQKWLSRAEWGIPVMVAGQYFNHNGPWYYHLLYILTTTPVLHLALVFGPLLINTNDPAARIFIRSSFLTLVVYLMIFMLPFAPRFDGERLLLPVYPFLSLLSFFGLWGLSKRLKPSPRFILVSFVLAASMYNPVRYHPYELSYYNCLAGGLRGAAGKGFTVTYWCEALTPETLAEIRKVIPREARVAFLPFGREVIDFHRQHSAVPETWHIVSRKDIGRSNDLFIITQNREELIHEDYPDLFKGLRPVYEKKLFDVPLIQVFYRQ